MSIFTFLFLTVLVGCSIPLMKLWQDGRRMHAVDSVGAADMKRQLDALQQRVAVLEKIVTDDKYELRRELELLDDSP